MSARHPSDLAFPCKGKPEVLVQLRPEGDYLVTNLGAGHRTVVETAEAAIRLAERILRMLRAGGPPALRHHRAA